MTWVMLNPSTADADTDDPTIRRCVGFAQTWGFGAIVVVNLFALRSTDPQRLRTHPDPIGPENDRFIWQATESSLLSVAAWGNHGSLRGDEVAAMIPRLQVLKMTGGGQPAHPLYLRRDLKPVPMGRPSSK